MEKLFFNAHHSPMGAFASFTLGYKGAKGGLGQELVGPADQNVFIGIENATRDGWSALPFFEMANDDISRYDIEKELDEIKSNIEFFADNEISRDFGISTDTWRAGDLTFKLISPVFSMPDPTTADDIAMKLAVAPVILAEIEIDNRQGKTPRQAFFGYQGNDPYSAMRSVMKCDNAPFIGIGQGQGTLIATRKLNAHIGIGFTLKEVIEPDFVENLSCGIGGVGAITLETPAGEIGRYQVAIAFYRSGIVTSRLETSYYYTRYFKNIDAVVNFALDNFDIYLERAVAAERMINDRGLNAEQHFMLAHAVRSYYGSTQLLRQADNEPLWVVNEGEYRMMNTFDLTVDQLFFETKMNPWTVKNELDMFVSRYSYVDKVRFPGDETEYPGGISFTHDMGVANVFARPEYSSYELFGLDGCFSHMTHEQLVNWILCGSVYYEATQDIDWLNNNLQIWQDCFASMCNRDNPDPDKRNGIMSLDSIRCRGGAEITTYDSLDQSLGQARNNIYMAVKCFAAYLAMEKVFGEQHLTELAVAAGKQAERCADTLLAHVTAEGYIPAVIDEDNDSRIIPVVEGLVFPYFNGCSAALDKNGRFGALISALKTHLETVLVPRVCLFSDGRWKLSSTSNNSWLSKTYLCQFVAQQILGLPPDPVADKGHCQQLLDDENSYFAWSDQMVDGIAKGSKYYPRGVTSILWLEYNKQHEV
jgi:xylan 1,4-beta-xylosidase